MTAKKHELRKKISETHELRVSLQNTLQFKHIEILPSIMISWAGFGFCVGWLMYTLTVTVRKFNDIY